MVEILKSFEQTASRFSPAVLIVPGLAMAVLGLVAWLAGMCLRRLTLGLIAAMAAGMAGLFFSRQNPAIACAAALGGAAAGAMAPRLCAAVFLALLGTAVAFAVTAQMYALPEQDPVPGVQNPGGPERRFTVRESLDVIHMYAWDLVDRVKAMARAWPPLTRVIVAGAGLGVLGMGLLLARPAGALTCSVLGAGMIFAGLTLLLIVKGSTPIVRLERQGVFFGLVLLAMVAFGTLEQLLLCPPPGRRNAPRGRSRSHWEESGRGWRGR